MLSYCTHLNVNSVLDRESVIHMFISWIQDGWNHMDNLEYDGSFSFEYSVGLKTLKIEDFDEQGILGLQFITSENNRKMTFIVEVMFDYINEYIDLNFYNELDDESVYHGIKGIPNIFNTILESEYVLEDNSMKISDKPHYMSRNEYDDMLKRSYNLPVVVLNKNSKINQLCVVNPNKLANKLYGIAHVVVINKAGESQLEILYPNTYKEKIQKDNEAKMLAICFSDIMEYHLRVNNEYLKYDDLVNIKLQDQHHMNEKDSKETLSLYKDEIYIYEEELKMLEEEYKQLNEEMILLNDKQKFLNKKKEESSKEAILFTTKTDYEEDKQVLYKLLKTKYNNYLPKTPFRKIPVLKSILGSQE